ncbi:MAG: caspase family protein, partial [Bacteroidota bacterium]
MPLRKHFPVSHAFIVAINDYDHVSSLRNAINDAEAIAAKLASEPHHYRVHPPLLNASYQELQELLQETMPATVQPEDRVLFYFAGHGVASDSDGQDPKGYLLPKDALRENASRSISMDL